MPGSDEEGFGQVRPRHGFGPVCKQLDYFLARAGHEQERGLSAFGCWAVAVSPVACAKEGGACHGPTSKYPVQDGQLSCTTPATRTARYIRSTIPRNKSACSLQGSRCCVRSNCRGFGLLGDLGSLRFTRQFPCRPLIAQRRRASFRHRLMLWI